MPKPAPVGGIAVAQQEAEDGNAGEGGAERQAPQRHAARTLANMRQRLRDLRVQRRQPHCHRLAPALRSDNLCKIQTPTPSPKSAAGFGLKHMLISLSAAGSGDILP